MRRSTAPAEPGAVEAAEAAHQLLLDDRREEELPGEEGREALAVAGQQLVEQRGAAPRVADHEHRLAHGAAAEARKEHVIEGHAERVEGGDEGDPEGEADEQHETRPARPIGEREAEHAEIGAQVEEHAASLPRRAGRAAQPGKTVCGAMR